MIDVETLEAGLNARLRLRSLGELLVLENAIFYELSRRGYYGQESD